MSSLAEFNRILKGAVGKARVVQKNDPAQSISLWLKIAEYALEFAKKQADFTLRRMIEKKVAGIIDRVKRIKVELELFAIQHVARESQEENATIPEEEIAVTTAEETRETSNGISAELTSPQLTEGAGEVPAPEISQLGDVQATLGQLRQEYPMEDGGKSIQDWLASIPDGFVEIPPTPNPVGSTDKSTSAGEEGGDGNSLTPAQRYFQELADEAEAREIRDGKGESAAKSAHDPFRTISATRAISPGKKVCFACGAIVDANDPFCSFCGTNLT